MGQVITFFTSLLIELYTLTGSLGTAIIILTILIRTVLIPFSLPTFKVQKKLKEIQPELNKLKNTHKGDRKALQQAQMELYKKYNVNPLGGCIPQIAQIAVAYFLYRALQTFLGMSEINGVMVQTSFFWLNLTVPDSLYILPVVAGLTQLVLSLMIVPATETPDVVPNNSSKKSVQKANEKEEDVADMAQTMQQQMVFMMPVIFGVTTIGFSSGLAIYMITTTVFSIVQQYILSGPGGIVLYGQRALAWVQAKTKRSV